MSKALIATSSINSDIVAEVPYLLKKAGYQVTLMCSERQKVLCGGFIDCWIDTGEDLHLIYQKFAKEIETSTPAYDFLVVANDGLLFDIAKADFPLNQKLKLSPLENSEYIEYMGSKYGTAAICDKIGIAHVPFKICKSLETVIAASGVLGFPLIIKFDNCAAGIGVFYANDIAGIHAAFEGAKDRKLDLNTNIIAQKFIDGEELSPLPLFMHGKLIAYTVGRLLGRYDNFGVSYGQEFYFDPDFAEMFEKIGRELQLNGMINFGFIKEKGTGKLWLFEMDMRPSIWFNYSRYAGMDFAHVLRDYKKNPLITWRDYVSKIKTKKVYTFHRETDAHLLRHGGFGFLKFLIKRNFYLPFLPYHDPKLLFSRITRLYNHWHSVSLDRLIAYLQRYADRHRKRNP